MVKTTINLDTEVYKMLVREALDKYGTTKMLSRIINEKLKKAGISRDGIVEKTFGLWNIKETGSQYTRHIRREAENKVKRDLNE